ncbi:MAG TPA: hypothetical protein VFQ53_02115 [Kofleriaceae bacterium]|nr:hypothetical protein [Kofleriaceae bacterium]
MSEVVEVERRRAKLVYTLIAAFGVIVAIGIVVFTILFLRDRPADACTRLLGPTDRYEQLAGTKLESRGGVGGGLDCDVTLWQTGATSVDPAVKLSNRPASQYDDTRKELEASGSGTIDGNMLVFSMSDRHVILFRHGETMTRLELDAHVFDVVKARQLAQEVMARAR